jgi:hypothetical protein
LQCNLHEESIIFSAIFLAADFDLSRAQLAGSTGRFSIATNAL